MRCERIVERVHEHAAHHVDDEHRAPLAASNRLAPRPGVPGGIVGGADQARLALDEHQRLALVEGVVAERDRVDAGGEEFLADRLGDAEAAGGVLAVDDDEIEPPALAQGRRHGRAARRGRTRPTTSPMNSSRISASSARRSISRSVTMASSGSSCAS